MTADSTQAILIFAIGTGGMLLMAIAIIFFVLFYQKKMLSAQLEKQRMEAEYQLDLLRAQLESEENERRRVAKDLHDDVGLMLQALRFTTLTVLQQASEQDRKEVQQMVTDVTESVRRISWDLMPSSLEYFGLTEAVDELCTRLSTRTNLPITFSFQGAARSILKEKQTLIYRMVQELVANSLKHSKATAIEVKFTWEDGRLVVSVMDNGIGFDLNDVKNRKQPGHGLGLLSLENRSRLLPASLVFENNFPQGTIVSITYLQNE